MVIYYLLLLMPFWLLSAEFTATVSKIEIGQGEAFKLNLILKDATAKAPPSLDSLKQNFLIHSQQQSSSTMMINGDISTTVTWTMGLIPQVLGTVEIPSISLDTNQGMLFTQAITISVSAEQKNQEFEGLKLDTEVSNLKPYKNEPFFFAVKLLSKQKLANLQILKFDIEGAIVEPVGEPTIREKIDQGLRVSEIEFKFLITPLKNELKIPSITVQGSILQKRNMRSLFDDDFDPFLMMHGLQPFVLSTKEQNIDIHPPIAGMTPWLPAKALEIQEIWDSSQKLQEGEVLTRSFIITADGITSSQIPNLESTQKGPFKVYIDKPELKDEIINGRLKSSRTEHYTIIPQQAGELILPEISIKWWDTQNHQLRESKIPERKLQIIPAAITPIIEQKATIDKTASLNSMLLSVLAGLLVIACLFIIILIRKLNHLKGMKESKRKEVLDDLNPT